MLLDPIIEYTHIAQWLDQLVGTSITPHSFVRSLSRRLNKRYPIQVKLQLSNELDIGDHTVGAFYDPVRDESGRKCLIFVFIINYEADVLWTITKEIANQLVLELTEALIHEYQHQYQYRSRGYVLNKSFESMHHDTEVAQTQEYLGNPDEIDAYAANIAARIYLQKKLRLDNRPSLDLGSYYSTFGKDHLVVKTLLRKITKNLDQLHLSKNAVSSDSKLK